MNGELLLPRFLFGTSAHNPHAQNMAAALWEAEALFRYVTGGVDVFTTPAVRVGRRALARILPRLDRELRRRAVDSVPSRLVESHWGWESLRLAANRARAIRAEDYCWERSELALDERCAALMATTGPDAFLGIEHGALAALQASRAVGKPGVVAFLSPHHATRAKWVDAEFSRHPELRTPSGTELQRLAIARDARRDAEANAANWVITNSSFTTRSLVEGGVPAEKILTVPLAAPPAIQSTQVPQSRPRGARFIYAGPVSVRKGAHYLLRAWREIAGDNAELHLYGRQTLPASVIDEAKHARGGEHLFLHGSVPAADLPEIYRQGTALVLPTLCDGFAQVIGDALANGLPVITTGNAGGADLIRHGVSGLIVPPADAPALAAAMAWFIANPGDLGAMRAEALDAARRWTWTDYRHAFRGVLDLALRDGRATSAAFPSQAAAHV